MALVCDHKSLEGEAIVISPFSHPHRLQIDLQIHLSELTAVALTYANKTRAINQTQMKPNQTLGVTVYALLRGTRVNTPRDEVSSSHWYGLVADKQTFRPTAAAGQPVPASDPPVRT